jgi:hypothetical protein
MSYTPQRTQYPYPEDLKNKRYKSKADLFRLEQQWNTFERIENFDDVIFQRVQDGLRDQSFYQFRTNSESKDYRAGQELHVLQYPELPVSTFSPVREGPFPTTEAKTALPGDSQVNKYIVSAPTMSADEFTQIRADNEIYMYVSTYNQRHVYKYNFISDEEKQAYQRAERRLG